MSKIITSPVDEFAGTITLKTPLNIYECMEIEKAIGDPKEAGKKVFVSTKDAPALVALIACSERWDITGIETNPTVDNFPATPRGASHKLIDFAFNELFKIYFGEMKIPNG